MCFSIYLIHSEVHYFIITMIQFKLAFLNSFKIIHYIISKLIHNLN